MSQAKPVIAIVPGGFCGPQIYQDVASALRDDGFTVVIPTLTTTKDLSTKDPTSAEYKDFASKGLPDDVKEIHDSLASELDKGSEVVIFGHSYGSLPALISLEGQTVEERKAKGLSGGIKAYAAVSGFAYTMRGKNIMGTTEDLPVMPYHTLEVSLYRLVSDDLLTT
jgi:predicted alpha/beta hydrolase